MDGVYQTDTSLNNMAMGKLLDVPVMMGYTNHEFFIGPQSDDIASLKKEARERFGERGEEL